MLTGDAGFFRAVEEGEQISFKFYDASTKTEYDMQTEVTFVKDGIQGNAIEPLIVTGVELDIVDPPLNFRLAQNYPNPFNPSTTIMFDLPSASKVVLKVYDILGREVYTLIDANMDGGFKEIIFDTDNINSRLMSGVYVYTLNAGDFVQTRKLMLMK